MKLDKDRQAHIVDQLVNKSWGELEVLEHAGYLLFPEKLYQRQKDGTFKETPICIRVPREPEVRTARIKARKICEDEGLDPAKDPDLFDNVDAVCLLSVAIRNTTEPHEPFEPDPKRLERVYDKGSIMALWAKLDGLTQLVNPRPSDISEEQMIALTAAIAKERNIHPLHVFDGPAQNDYIVTMASLLHSLLEQKSSSESSGTSTPEPSN
jgi:hypothetical protein